VQERARYLHMLVKSRHEVRCAVLKRGAVRCVLRRKRSAGVARLMLLVVVKQCSREVLRECAGQYGWYVLKSFTSAAHRSSVMLVSRRQRNASAQSG